MRLVILGGMGSSGLFEPLGKQFVPENFSDIFNPIWIAAAIGLVITIVLYNVRTRQLHRHEPLRTMQEWLLWTGMATFSLILIGAIFRFYFLFVLAFIVIGIATFIWVRFYRFPPYIEAYNGSIGLPLPSTEIAIRDDDRKDVPIGQPGEIAIRGPQVMKGYWQRPEETAKVIGPDGFLYTGDVGVMDEKGFVTIVDRKKDMILVSGFNVYPNEIEQVVAMHPGVLECAAIGVPDEHSGEVPKLFVVKKDPGLTEQDVLEHCKKELTGYKRPKYVEFRAELPKTNVGKILRRALREEKKAA